MPTARLGAALLALGAALLAAGPVAADPVADREAALLHRRLDLAAVRQWSRSRGAWQPVTIAPAAVYVVNLWSIQCKPCLAELPLLRNVVAGWKPKPEVQFLFIADPPDETSESEAAAFWQHSRAAVPDADPLRASGDDLRRSLGDGAEPITLLVDEHLIVRQAFIGSLFNRPLGRSIERLLQLVRSGEVGRETRRRGGGSVRESNPPSRGLDRPHQF